MRGGEVKKSVLDETYTLEYMVDHSRVKALLSFSILCSVSVDLVKPAFCGER